MSEWRQMALGDLLRPVRRPALVSDMTEVPWAGVRWYAGGVYARPSEPASKVKSRALNRIERNDVTYNRMWATKGAFGVVGADAAGCLVSNDFPIFMADSGQVMPGFIRLVFQSPAFQAEAASRAVGTTERRRLKESDFLALAVAVPPLQAQRRIIDLMASVDGDVAALEHEVDAIRRTTVSLRSYLLEPKSHWEQVAIGDVAQPATGRAFPDRFQGVGSGVVPYFKVADMNAPENAREMVHAPNWLSDHTAAQVKPRICPAGTVIFPIIGAAMLTEKRRMLVRPSAFDQNVMGLILGDRVLPEYMFAAMSNVRLGDFARSGAVPSVNQAVVSAIRIPLPPLDEQKAIGATLVPMHEVTERAEAELRDLRTFRSALLVTLLNREIGIPPSYDRLLPDDVA